MIELQLIYLYWERERVLGTCMSWVSTPKYVVAQWTSQDCQSLLPQYNWPYSHHLLAHFSFDKRGQWKDFNQPDWGLEMTSQLIESGLSNCLFSQLRATVVYWIFYVARQPPGTCPQILKDTTNSEQVISDGIFYSPNWQDGEKKFIQILFSIQLNLKD